MKLITILGILCFFFKSATFQAVPGVSPVPVTTVPETPKELPIHDQKPGGTIWPGNYSGGNNQRNVLADWLVNGNWDTNFKPSEKQKSTEYPGYDGWYNNLARPDSGAIDRPLLRRWPAAYKDGTYLPAGFDRPNPLDLSDKLLGGRNGLKSKNGKSALLVFFGQQIVEEILDAQRPACPPEYINIDIPDNHTFRDKPGHTQMPVLRTRYDMRTGFSPNNPRQQLNEITPYIDGGLFYGTTKQWSDQLRTYSNKEMDKNGELASSRGGLFPEVNDNRLPMANPPPPFHHRDFILNHETKNVNRFFMLGNPRGNENAFLLTFGIMWFRWHNYLAKRIRHHQPSWSSEKVYNEARKWVIATQQQIYVYEWLPALFSETSEPVLDRYKRYDASIDPQIDQFFQSAAFRFGHTLVVSGVYLRDYVRNKCGTNFFSWKQKAIRTCNIFWRPQDPILSQAKNDSDELIDIDRILMGLSVQLSEQEDHTIVKDLRGNVFGPLEFSRRDLMALNIQRGRDHGLPDFNSARKAFGLDPYKDFEAFKSVTAETRKTLSDLYNHNINNIDVWIGGILETSNGPGELFREIIKDQFRRIRDGDRFWFENEKNGLFSKEEITRIKQIKIYDIIMAVTKMDGHDIPSMPFRVATKNSPNVLRTECHLNNTGDYYHLPPLSDEALAEDCTVPGTYDFFQKSEASYILTFAAVGVFNIGVVGFAYFLIVHKEKAQTKSNAKENENRRKTFKNDPNSKVNWPLFIVTEWVGPKHPSREIILSFKANLKKICVTCFNGTTLRALDLSNTGITQVTIYNITDRCTLMLNTKHNYDLVVTFESEFLRNNFLSEFDKHFVQSQIVKKEVVNLNWNAALKIVVTKNDRQARLEMFFRVVFAQAFKINHSNTEILRVDAHVAKEVVDTELTITEFADSLSMVPGNEFVKRMFALIDKDKNGFISFREFVDLMIIFADGSEEQKAKLLFDMYDIDGVGHLKQEDFINMIKSFLETCGGKVDDKDIQRTVQSMLKNAGAEHKQKLTFEDFKKMIGDDIKNLNTARLGFKGIKEADHSYLAKAKDTIENIYESKQEIEARFKGQGVVPESEYRNSAKLIDENQEEFIKTHKNTVPDNKYTTALKFIELKSKEIFWLSLYTSIIWAIFIERAYYYSIEREHGGLRQIAGYGVTVTRGAASAMMFAYASLLVTMCRNMITYLRDTVANKYFPFDASLDFHKYIAIWGFIFSVAHIIGHAFNFYHITTQTADDLSCLFNNYFHATHELPKFHYWCWQTLTGFSGVIVTLLWIVMYSFALPIIRRKIYNWFWYTHNLYPYFYIFMILHGAGRLIQPPFFYYFFLAPVILFAIDTLISISRKKIEIPVIKAGILPSNVTTLEFRKPENFQYKAGQWVRIACMGLNKNEYHPFTLSSAPDEDNLTVHIRAVGPWTKLVRTIYENSISANQKLPKIYLDGPYGEGHQDWDTYDVAILVGGGIGVTPFASILKDVALRSSRYRTHCQKVYFIWVSRTQKQFEWLVDIIRDVENKDTKQLLSIHIFITQFYEKFDLRTILLYICERHYQRVSNKSLFTNLRAVTHFGRPAFAQFFKTIQYIHESAQRIGVFSCGPPSMTSAVDHACSKINQQSEQKFEHFFKNF